jgi:hypothetical protein
MGEEAEAMRPASTNTPSNQSAVYGLPIPCEDEHALRPENGVIKGLCPSFSRRLQRELNKQQIDL